MIKDEIHAIILARKNSKGIKNKNRILLNEKPMIYWTIMRALQSKKILHTWVSSDSEKILSISKKLGAEVICRPSKFSKDTSSSESAWIDAIKQIYKQKKYPKIIVGLQVTSPFRKVNHIDDAIKKFKIEKYDSMFSSSIIKDHFIWKYNNKKLLPNYDVNNRKPRQKIKSQYLENGSIYIFKTEKFLKHKSRLFGKIGNFIMSKKYSFQIDTIEDAQIVNSIMKFR
jgi:N-acylneuraminate cytidylyltransferase